MRIACTLNLVQLFKMRLLLISIYLLLRSHSPNDVPPEPQWNVPIAAVRGAVRPSNISIYVGGALNNVKVFSVKIYWAI